MSRITTIKVSRTISMGHRLPSYKGICSSPHGHNVQVDVVVRVPEGKFIDFKVIDKALAKILDGMDHAMVLYEKDPLLSVLRDGMPLPFRTYALPVEPTTEAIAGHVLDLMKKALYDQHIVSCTVHETGKYSATVEAS